MNENFTIYTLNENCIAKSLSDNLGDKQRLAVPHLSVLNGALNDITSGNTVALVENDFLQNGRLSVWYDSLSKKMYLGGKGQNRESVIQLDCTPFINDGMISSVTVVDEDPTTVPPSHGVFLKIVWNSDSGHSTTYVNVKDMIENIYSGDGKYINVDKLEISFDSDKFSKDFKEGSNGLSNTYDKVYGSYQFLAGHNEDYTSGAIGKISSDIQNLQIIGAKNLKYISNIDDASQLSTYDSLSAFLKIKIGDVVENGTYLPVKFGEGVTIQLEDGLKVCDGDVVIVHVDGNTKLIPVEDIKLGENATVQKGGVSRYEHLKNAEDISTKIFIVNPDSGLSDYSDLSVVKIGKGDFESIVASGGVLNQRTLYIVSSDIIDAYGQRIQNVFDASELSDAVNLKQLQNTSSELHEWVENKIDGLSIDNEVLSSENGDVSVITEISEAGGIISIKKSRLEKSMVNGLTGTLDDLCAGLSTKIYVVNPDVPLSDYSDLSVVKIGTSEYEQLVAGENGVNPRTLYVVSSDVIDAYGQQIKNISCATDLSDAVNLEQLNKVENDLQDEISSIQKNQIVISGNVDEISGKVDGKIYIVNSDVGLSNYSDLSVVKITKDDFESRISEGENFNPSTLYIISSNVIDAYGQKIENLAPASGLSDAVNLEQLNNKQSEIQEWTENKISSTVNYKKIMDYYNESGLSGYNSEQWMGMNSNRMIEMLSVLFEAFCK